MLINLSTNEGCNNNNFFLIKYNEMLHSLVLASFVTF